HTRPSRAFTRRSRLVAPGLPTPPTGHRRFKMKRLLALAGLIAAMSLPASSALAASPGTHGQPSQSCQSFFGDAGPFTPAGFNSPGFNHAETVYAGAQPQNSNNPAAVSQYDVACFQAASH